MTLSSTLVGPQDHPWPLWGGGAPYCLSILPALACLKYWDPAKGTFSIISFFISPTSKNSPSLSPAPPWCLSWAISYVTGSTLVLVEHVPYEETDFLHPKPCPGIALCPPPQKGIPHRAFRCWNSLVMCGPFAPSSFVGWANVAFWWASLPPPTSSSSSSTGAAWRLTPLSNHLG